MNFKIDSRESSEDLFDAFDIMCYERKCTYEKVFLEVGDIVVGNIVIERKEASDFVGSIMDRRLKEQAAKMSYNFENKYIIIEGSPYRTGSFINPNAIVGQMVSLAVKHNIKLIFVENSHQLAYACYAIAKKHEENWEFDPNNYTPNKFKVSHEDTLTSMIYQIPGVGWDKAEKIAAMYHYSLPEMVNDMQVHDLTMLEGIGVKTAKKICEYFK
ncbi:MAG: ERCC4 domain-containing protein [bacterium]